MASTEKLYGQFEEHLAVLRKVRKQDLSAVTHDRRRFALKARDLLGKGVVCTQGLPKTLQSWVAGDLLGAQVDIPNMGSRAFGTMPIKISSMRS